MSYHRPPIKEDALEILLMLVMAFALWLCIHAIVTRDDARPGTVIPILGDPDATF